MTTTSSDPNIVPRWRIYLQGGMFALPGVIAWVFACVYLVPKLREVCYAARLEPTQLGGLWNAAWFLVQGGQSFWIYVILILAFPEFFGRGYAPYRRATVGLVVWVVNVAVLFGLTLFLMLALIAGASVHAAK